MPGKNALPAQFQVIIMAMMAHLDSTPAPIPGFDTGMTTAYQTSCAGMDPRPRLGD